MKSAHYGFIIGVLAVFFIAANVSAEEFSHASLISKINNEAGGISINGLNKKGNKDNLLFTNNLYLPESGFEVGYKVRLLKKLFLQPGVRYFANPKSLQESDTSLGFGTKLELKF